MTPSKRLPRLKDVAQEAKLSVGAASRILRGDTNPFGAEAVDRVLAAANRLGWRRNLLVSGMQTGRTKTVGVLIPPFDSFWINVLSGIHNRLTAADYLPITIWIGDLEQLPSFEADDKAGLVQINRLLDRRVDALIMWPQIALSFRSCFAEVAEKNVPVVVIDLHDDDPFGDSVVTSEANSTCLVAEHLMNLGHRRVGCFTERDDPSHSWATARVKYFQQAIQRTPDATVSIARLGPHGDDGERVVHALLTQNNQPTAIFAVTDHMAEIVYRVAAKLGLRIPDDLSVVGFSDLDFAATFSPPLTTIHQYPKKIGAKAVELVLERLVANRKPEKFKTVEIDGELVIRESTAPPKN